MSDFYSLAHAAQEDPESADFAALRLAYVQSSVYRPFKHIPQSKLLQITNNAADFAEVSRTCQTLLEANPMDLEARLLLGIAQEKAGQTAQAEKTKRFAEKMLDSILATGNGKTPASALQVIAEAEVWTVIRSFGIRTNSHTRQQTDSHTYDIFTGSIGERQVTIYFDVSALMSAFDQEIVGQE
jgi:hypothetical protein